MDFNQDRDIIEIKDSHVPAYTREKSKKKIKSEAKHKSREKKIHGLKVSRLKIYVNDIFYSKTGKMISGITKNSQIKAKIRNTADNFNQFKA
jgi:hypothetical protein